MNFSIKPVFRKSNADTFYFDDHKSSVCLALGWVLFTLMEGTGDV